MEKKTEFPAVSARRAVCLEARAQPRDERRRRGKCSTFAGKKSTWNLLNLLVDY